MCLFLHSAYSFNQLLCTSSRALIYMYPFNVIWLVRVMLVAALMSLCVGATFVGTRWRFWDSQWQRNASYTLLEKFGRISLYLTNDAIANLQCDVKFSQKEGNGRKFRQIGLSNNGIRNFVYQCIILVTYKTFRISLQKLRPQNNNFWKATQTKKF